MSHVHTRNPFYRNTAYLHADGSSQKETVPAALFITVKCWKPQFRRVRNWLNYLWLTLYMGYHIRKKCLWHIKWSSKSYKHTVESHSVQNKKRCVCTCLETDLPKQRSPRRSLYLTKGASWGGTGGGWKRRKVLPFLLYKKFLSNGISVIYFIKYIFHISQIQLFQNYYRIGVYFYSSP